MEGISVIYENLSTKFEIKRKCSGSVTFPSRSFFKPSVCNMLVVVFNFKKFLFMFCDIRQTIVSACQSGLPNFPDTPINKRIHAACHCATIAEAVNWIVIDVNVRVFHPSINPSTHVFRQLNALMYAVFS